MPNLSNFYKVMLIFECSRGKCSWFGTGITSCKLGYPLPMKIMASTDFGIFLVESIILVVNGDVASLVASLHDVNWRVFDCYRFICLHSINIFNFPHWILFNFIFIGAIKNLTSLPIWSTSCTESRMSVSNHYHILRTLYRRMT
jgi:hypothetical protein